MAKKVQPQKKASKSATKKSTKKMLAKVPTEYVFWCHDGSMFSDLYELAEGLKTMSDETFTYHSNLEKHDFSNWIRDIIGNSELADALMMVTSRPEAISCIVARINA
jgi:hypothetical protein